MTLYDFILLYITFVSERLILLRDIYILSTLNIKEIT